MSIFRVPNKYYNKSNITALVVLVIIIQYRTTTLSRNIGGITLCFFGPSENTVYKNRNPNDSNTLYIYIYSQIKCQIYILKI